MNEGTAKKVCNCALAFDPLLDDLGKAVDAMEDEVLRHRLKKTVGDLMGAVYSEVMYPLERQFPGLIPEKERRNP